MKERKPDTDRTEEEQGMEPRLTIRKPKGHAALGRDVQAKIGQQLRAYYDSLVEPTPDRFSDLLQQLDKADRRESSE
jgi:hypothetical protein